MGTDGPGNTKTHHPAAAPQQMHPLPYLRAPDRVKNDVERQIPSHPPVCRNEGLRAKQEWDINAMGLQDIKFERRTRYANHGTSVPLCDLDKR